MRFLDSNEGLVIPQYDMKYRSEVLSNFMYDTYTYIHNYDIK